MSIQEQHWYEANPAISRSLKLLKPLPNYVQELLGKQLHSYAKELSFTLSLNTDNTENSSTQGLNRLRHLMQNKSHHPLVGRALNEIMTLNDTGQNLVGQRMLLCLQALDNMAREEEDGLTASHEHRIEVHSVIRAVFSEDIEEFEKRGKEKEQQKQERRDAQRAEEAATKIHLEEAAKQMQEMDMTPPELDILDLPTSVQLNGPKTVPLSTLFAPKLKRVGRMLVLMLPTDITDEDTDPILGEATFSEKLSARREKTLASLADGLEENNENDTPVNAFDLLHANRKDEDSQVELLNPSVTEAETVGAETFRTTEQEVPKKKTITAKSNKDTKTTASKKATAPKKESASPNKEATAKKTKKTDTLKETADVSPKLATPKKTTTKKKTTKKADAE